MTGCSPAPPRRQGDAGGLASLGDRASPSSLALCELGFSGIAAPLPSACVLARRIILHVVGVGLLIAIFLPHLTQVPRTFDSRCQLESLHWGLVATPRQLTVLFYLQYTPLPWAVCWCVVVLRLGGLSSSLASQCVDCRI